MNQMDEVYEMQDIMTPSILVVDDDPIEHATWSRISMRRDDIEITCSESPNKILFDWLRLYADDHIPRVLIVDWHLNRQTMGVLRRQSASGTNYAIDGAAFVLVSCMEAVGDDAGMFVAYTGAPDAVRLEAKRWPAHHRDRLHIIDKNSMTCEELVQYIEEHDDYIGQSSGYASECINVDISEA